MQIELQTTEDPFRELANMMGQMMDQMGNRDFYQFSSRESWEPAINVYETQTRYVLCMDLAGMKREEIDVRTIGGRLVVRGSRSDPALDEPEGAVSIHVMEISSGTFSREMSLPADVHEEGIQAGYRDGYLWVTMPRTTDKAD